MKISINYLKKYLDFELPAIPELLERIGAQLGAIDEGAVDQWEIYNQVIVAKVVSCQKIEGSDHLNLCKIDDGHKHVDDSIRDDQGLIQVVCGANNIAADQLVAWLPPKSVVPSTFFKDKSVLESKELKGNISHGMIASSKELMIDDDHSGILLIDVEAKAGDSFAKLYELDDFVIDIENKMFTHRPDCFGLLGIAREVAGILNKPFKSPDWYLNQPKFEPKNEEQTVAVENEIPSLAPRFSLISMDKVSIKPSPILIKSYLSRMGLRPVNSIVDATNLCMLETGQPLHAYDYDKLKKLSNGQVKITVRNPLSNEKIALINEKTVEPSSNSIVIACNEAVGLGGIMGATNSSISDETKSIVIESASFDMYSIRRTAMELGIFSDAVTRFTKGQSPLQTTRVLVRATELIKQLCGSEVIISSNLVDNNNLPEATIKRDSLTPEIEVSTDFVNTRLGTELSVGNMVELLSNVECQTEASSSEITINAPFWRTDLEIREDVVEEVGRLYGYDRIELKPLLRSIKPAKTNADLDLKDQIRQLLSSAGANEALTYSFISKRLINASNQDENKAFRLANSLSPDVEFYRPSLIPSLLNKTSSNIRAGYDAFSLFEMGSYYITGEQNVDGYKSLALIYASVDKSNEASYYQARAYLEFLLDKLNLQKVNSISLTEKLNDLPPSLIEVSKPFEPGRSAVITTSEGQIVGIIGEFSSQSRRMLKLPINCSGFEVDMSLFKTNSSTMSYHKLSRFPSIKQDMTLKVPSSVKYIDLYNLVASELENKNGNDSYSEIELLSIFQPEKDTEFTNYSFRITISDYNKTLKDDEVNSLLDQVAEIAKTKLNAARI